MGGKPELYTVAVGMKSGGAALVPAGTEEATRLRVVQEAVAEVEGGVAAGVEEEGTLGEDTVEDRVEDMAEDMVEE